MVLWVDWAWLSCPHLTPIRKIMGGSPCNAGQEATVRTGHGTREWFQIRKGVLQGCIVSRCLFDLYAEYIIRNAGLDEAPSWNQDCWEKYQSFRYPDDTTIMAEKKGELKIFW